MLLGRNGAGKTTCLRTIMGLWRASQGAIRLGEATISALPASAVARAGVAYVPETMAIFSDLSVKENLLLAARDGPMDEARLQWIFGFFPGAEEILALARGLAVGRTEADGLDRARDHRAAAPAADRRADQGPRARRSSAA